MSPPTLTTHLRTFSYDRVLKQRNLGMWVLRTNQNPRVHEEQSKARSATETERSLFCLNALGLKVNI